MPSSFGTESCQLSVGWETRKGRVSFTLLYSTLSISRHTLLWDNYSRFLCSGLLLDPIQSTKKTTRKKEKKGERGSQKESKYLLRKLNPHRTKCFARTSLLSCFIEAKQDTVPFCVSHFLTCSSHTLHFWILNEVFTHFKRRFNFRHWRNRNSE